MSHSTDSVQVADDLHRTHSQVKFRWFNKSDDNLIILDGIDSAIIFLDFCQNHPLGLKSAGKSFTFQFANSLGAGEFLSLRFYRDPVIHFCVPKLGRMLPKLFWTCHIDSVHQPTVYARQVALGVRWLRDFPIIGPCIRQVLRLTQHVGDVEAIKSFDQQYMLDSDDPFPFNENRQSCVNFLKEVYDISEEEIGAAEALIMSVTKLPHRVENCKAVDKLANIDILEKATPVDCLFTEKDFPEVRAPGHSFDFHSVALAPFAFSEVHPVILLRDLVVICPILEEFILAPLGNLFCHATGCPIPGPYISHNLTFLFETLTQKDDRSQRIFRFCMHNFLATLNTFFGKTVAWGWHAWWNYIVCVGDLTRRFHESERFQRWVKKMLFTKVVDQTKPDGHKELETLLIFKTMTRAMGVNDLTQINTPNPTISSQ